MVARTGNCSYRCRDVVSHKVGLKGRWWGDWWQQMQSSTAKHEVELRESAEEKEDRVEDQRCQRHQNNVHRINWPGFLGTHEIRQPVGSNLGPLYVCYGWVAWYSCETRTVGRRQVFPELGRGMSPILLPASGTFSSYWVVLSSCDMICTWAYCSLFCCVW